MRKLALALLLVPMLAIASPSAAVEAPPVMCAVDALTGQAKCCKICKKGKACGDSCIAKNKTCTKEKGCACNAPQ